MKKIFEILIWTNTKFYKEKTILNFIEYMFIKYSYLRVTYYKMIRDNKYFGFKSIDKLYMMIDND
jgi:hypothetical protein